MSARNQFCIPGLVTALVVTALCLGGCATATQTAAMAPKTEWHVNKNAGAVTIHVGGGSETSAMGASKIADEDFAKAIQQAIADSGLFAKSEVNGSGDYRLDVQIARLQQPMFGASFTVVLETTWRLSRQSDNAILWEKPVVTNFTANMSDAFVGVTRLRLATEGAARNNINDAITQIGAIALK